MLQERPIQASQAGTVGTHTILPGTLTDTFWDMEERQHQLRQRRPFLAIYVQWLGFRLGLCPPKP